MKDMSNTRLTCYIYFNNILLNTYKEMGENIFRMINEIIEVSDKLTIPMEEFGFTKPEISLIDITKLSDDHELIQVINENKLLSVRNNIRLVAENLLSITIVMPVPETVVEGFAKAITDVDKDILNVMSTDETNRILIFSIFKKRIIDLITAANLTHFGSMPLFRGIIIQDGDRTERLDEIKAYILYHAMKFVEEIRYPVLHRLNFLSVWNWIIKREDFLTGFSNGSTGRALCCFSMLLNSEHPNLLFRSIMGIESLYAKGNGNLQEQVREKSQELLGKQESYKKLYTNMYNFRSRYIHGDLDFPVSENLDYTDKTTKYNKELEQATNYAIALLGATLQELIIRDWNGLEFKYDVTDSKK